MGVRKLTEAGLHHGLCTLLETAFLGTNGCRAGGCVHGMCRGVPDRAGSATKNHPL